MLKVKVGADYHVEVPEEIRKCLGIRAGDSLLAEVRGNSLVLVPEPGDYVTRMRGLHKEIWEGIDPQEYVNQLRGEWPE